jgi:PBSX family phage portal protein
MEAFSFGDPTPVLDGSEILDYLEAWFNGRWYEPPVNLDGLARSTRASVYLQSGLTFKRNMLSRTFIPHRLLSRAAFEQFALDWLWCGNAYLEVRRNRLGQPLSLQPPLAKYMRRGREDGQFFQVMGWQQEHEFERGTVLHLREAAIDQEIYGLPEWMAALQSALLNESATLFRRRYYLNGSHAGFILYVSDAAQDQKDVDAMREALKKSKGPGNFRNLFLYSPNGKKDGIQVIPISEVAAKDEFSGIKNITRDDMLAGLRIPPQLMGVVPQNAGGFGSIRDAALVYAANELEPIQARMLQVNDWIGEEVIRFKPYELPGATA